VALPAAVRPPRYGVVGTVMLPEMIFDLYS